MPEQGIKAAVVGCSARNSLVAATAAEAVQGSAAASALFSALHCTDPGKRVKGCAKNWKESMATEAKMSSLGREHVFCLTTDKGLNDPAIPVFI